MIKTSIILNIIKFINEDKKQVDLLFPIEQKLKCQNGCMCERQDLFVRILYGLANYQFDNVQKAGITQNKTNELIIFVRNFNKLLVNVTKYLQFL